MATAGCTKIKGKSSPKGWRGNGARMVTEKAIYLESEREIKAEGLD